MSIPDSTNKHTVLDNARQMVGGLGRSWEGLGDQRQELVSVLLPVGDIFRDGTPHLTMSRFSHDALF